MRGADQIPFTYPDLVSNGETYYFHAGGIGRSTGEISFGLIEATP